MKSLRTKTIFIVGGTTASFLALIYFIATTLLWQGFKELELREAKSNIERISNRVHAELASISTKASDWAYWDDAYEYMASRGDAFIASNLDPNATLANLNMDLLLFVAPDFSLAAALQRDSTSLKPIPVRDATFDLMENQNFQSAMRSMTEPMAGFKAIINIGPEPWLIAARPITKTDHSGAIRGYIVMGRTVDVDLVKTFSDELEFPMTLSPSPPILNGNAKYTITEVSSKELRALTPFYTSFQEFAYTLDVKFNREIMAEGTFTILLMLGLITIATAGLAFLVIMLLQKQVISRIENLRHGAETIANSESPGTRVYDPGNDEIKTLAMSINHMVGTIEERNQQIEDIIHHVKFGFLMVTPNLTIMDGYTDSCEELLGKSGLKNLSFADAFALTGDQSGIAEMIFDQLKDGIIPDDVTLRQMPKTTNINGRTLRYEGEAIRTSESGLEKVLFSITDVTDLSRAEQENQRNRALIGVFKARQSFVSLVTDFKRQIPVLEIMITQNQDNDLRMALHTLNGNFRCFGMHEIVDWISEIEDQSTIESGTVRTLANKVKDWLATHQPILGIEWELDELAFVWNISESTLRHLERQVQASTGPTDNHTMFQWLFSELRTKPLNDLRVPLETLTSDAATRLGKKARLRVSTNEIRLPPEQFQAVADMLPHLIRNAIDHGLEATEDRPNAKSAEGILRLEFNRVSTGEIELTFQDDGVGIDIQNIAQIAIKRNIITTAQGLAMSSHDKLRLILEPRFSSRETISEFSGRGVGLSAVKSIIEDELGGSILITSKPGHGTTFLMHIPLTKKNKDRTQKKVA